MTEARSGETRSFDAVTWFHMPGSHFEHNGKPVGGYYSSNRNIIVMSDTLATYGGGARHEMLHAIVLEPGHPRARFLEQCAGVVESNIGCVKESTPWIAPGPFALFPADSLVVTTQTTLLPMDPDSTRWVTIHITATNPKSSAVYISPQMNAWQYQIARPDGSAVGLNYAAWSDSSMMYFAPNQTKDWTFELRVSSLKSRFTIAPGDYEVTGGFAGKFTPYAPFTAAK